MLAVPAATMQSFVVCLLSVFKVSPILTFFHVTATTVHYLMVILQMQGFGCQLQVILGNLCFHPSYVGDISIWYLMWVLVLF